MNYFPNNDEEISLIKFLAKFQYLNISDSKCFFASKRYYRNRISNLISKKFIKKVKSKLVLDELGIEYAQLFNFEYNKRNRNKKYLSRLLYLSHLAVFYYNCNLVTFTPSFDIKDKNIYTITSRRFIGILDINGFDYLTYYISKKHDNRYINSVIYDIQKEKNYRNIIVLINDIKRININDFIFGTNRVLIIEDNIENLEHLKYLHSINWSNLIKNYYKREMFLSEYNFCDFTDYKNKYISNFYFLDTEKINRIKYFLRENKDKTEDIICNDKVQTILKEQLPNAHYIVADIEKYIDKVRNEYG